MNFTRSDFNHLSNYFLAREAQRRGYAVRKMFPQSKRSHLIIEHEGRVATIIGQRLPSLSYNAYFICKHKDIAKQFLQKSGIRVPRGQAFCKDEVKEAIAYSKTLPKPLVIKPTGGTWGTDVFLNICTDEEVRSCIEKFSTKGTSFLIEEQSVGKEYRILATRDKTLGVIHRVPANVIGDGVSTIRELIDEKNSDPRRGDGHEKAIVRIIVDDEILKILAAKSLTLDSIPSKGQRIFLRQNSNISTGGDSIDYTDKVHPAICDLATKIIRAIPGLPYAGIDFLTPDITKNPQDVGYTVIELNDSPMLSMHHEPYEGVSRNVSAEIINMLFD